MSNSRLEKFIYAICGMEVDDLPTPLSRIETLWNCLITGEVPDFEPLSRNEKYLMAMLSGDIDGLPEPTSRSEKLLYKIATGETDLSDVPGYLSRYEELLKQLIENGGIGGTDFEYVLYTLNQPLSTLYTTAEGPVKSAILKGQTLVNVLNYSFRNNYSNVLVFNIRSLNNIKPLTSYLMYIIDETNKVVGFNISNNNSNTIIERTDGTKTKVTTNDFILNNQSLYIYPKNGIVFEDSDVNKIKIMLIEYQDGMENWDIPYFEGMQSVKMPVLTTTGKNLFDGELVKNKYYNGSTGELVAGNNNLASVNPIRVNPNTSIVLSTSANLVNNNHYICEYASDGTFIKRTNSSKITTSETTYFIKFHFAYETINESPNVQLEEGSTATSYEPYKSNILTTTSKNLFNMNRPYDNLTDSQATVVQDTNQITVSSSAESGIYVNANFILDKDFFAGKTVTGSCLYESDENDIGTVQIAYQDGNGEHHYQWIKTPRTFTFPNSFIGDVMLSISANNTDTPQSNTVTVKNIQLELGSTATPYEPYSEVTLRGIGDVKDTLNVNSGEVVEKTKQIVNHTTTGGMNRHMLTNETYFVATLPSIFTGSIENLWNNSALVCDKIPTKRDAGNSFCIYTAGQTPVISVPIATIGGDSLELFKQWYVNLSPSYVYKLATPVVKTVVLSITDQDGQPTKLSTFNDITYVSIEAEDLLPTVDLEVPTKIEETLSALPTLMNDISETQQLLNESIDVQAENINEVSTAITEIRSDIL